jgi:hypothetical protein
MITTAAPNNASALAPDAGSISGTLAIAATPVPIPRRTKATILFIEEQVYPYRDYKG